MNVAAESLVSANVSCKLEATLWDSLSENGMQVQSAESPAPAAQSVGGLKFGTNQCGLQEENVQTKANLREVVQTGILGSCGLIPNLPSWSKVRQ